MGDKLTVMPNRVSVEVMNLWLDQVQKIAALCGTHAPPALWPRV